MSARKLVIFGTQNFAEMAHHYFSTDSDYTVEAFCVDAAYLKEDRFLGLPVVSLEELPNRFPQSEYEVFVAIGIQRLNRARADKAEELIGLGYRLASYCSSKTDLNGVELGPNVMIMEGVGLHPRVKIGWNSIIWSYSRIGLNTRIGDHCWITSAALGEGIDLGDQCFVGLNATLRPFIKVGARCLIGAGCVIQQDLAEARVTKAPEPRVSGPSDMLASFDFT